MVMRGTLGGGKQGNRAGNRLRLALDGKLELTAGNATCHVENISRTGARVQHAAALSRGSPAILHVAERTLFATVTWVRGNVCGLRFAEAVPTEEMQRLLWITENREQYERETGSLAAREWSTGRAARDSRPRAA